MLTVRGRGIYKREAINMLHNMSAGGYVLGVFGIKGREKRRRGEEEKMRRGEEVMGR